MPGNKERLLTLFFAVLVFLHLGYVLLGFASIPSYYERVSNLTIETYGIGEVELMSNAVAQAGAQKRGLTLSQYAIEQIVFGSAIVLLSSVVAVLIVWRAKWNWFAWYSAFFMVFISEYALTNQIVVARLVSLWVFEVGSFGWALIFLYFFVFPNGKPVPRFGLWLILPLFLFHFLFQVGAAFSAFAPTSSLVELQEPLLAVFAIIIPVELILVFIFQTYRYFRVSSPLEKQQTKWFLFGLGAFVATLPLDEYLATTPYYDEINMFVFTFVPLSVGVAILRYRLWDIDVIIRRTLTYAVVTAFLGIVFFGSVILLQQFFATVTGAGQSEIVTVLSTLAIAALFIPLRDRVQSVVDKRFNRKKYDAQQVLQDFGNTVRDETDLEQLTGRLIQVVEETMQPKSVSLWLKTTDDARRGTQKLG